MIVNQISVFLENKAGQLADFVQLMAKNNIDLKALSIAESQDYGVLRIIVDDPDGVAALLRENSWTFTVTPVLAIMVPDEPGSLTHILAILAENGISLAYTYAFFSRKQGNAFIILRVDDNAKASKILFDANIALD